MRTLHVATERTWRGGEQQVLYLLEGLRDRGMPPVLATPGGSPLAARAAAAGIEVRDVPSRGDFDLRAAARLRRLLNDGIDILHLHTGHAHALGLLATMGRKRRPAVVVSRRVDFAPRGGLSTRFKFGGRVDRFVAISREVARVLREAGVPADRLTVVHSGVDPARFEVPRDGEGLRRELGVPPDVKLIGFVGALVGHKSPGDLLEALALLPSGVHAVMAGRGGLDGILRDRAGRPDLEGRVHFLGHRDDVPRLLRSVDLFCLPSRMEGLGTSVLDAMASGTPVVAAAGGGIPEMVEEGRSGLLVPPGRPADLAAAIRRVLEDPGLAKTLAEGGRKRVSAFTRERMVEGMIQVYKALIS